MTVDSGLAVIVGALIAITGSALVPWVRETLKERHDQHRDRQKSLRESVVRVLAANHMAGFALQLKDVDRVVTAMSDRSTATAELLVAVSKEERGDMARVLARSIPVRGDEDDAEIVDQIRALQVALVSWVNDEIPSTSLNALYEKVLGKAKKPAPQS